MSNEIGSALRDRLMEEVERLRAELADCRMELDASGNAEELRQVRAELDAAYRAGQADMRERAARVADEDRLGPGTNGQRIRALPLDAD